MIRTDNPEVQFVINRIAWMQDDLDDFKAFAQGRDDTFADIWADALARMQSEIEEERDFLRRLKGYDA